MKKIFLLVAAAFLCLGTVYAQAADVGEGISFVGAAPAEVYDYDGNNGYLIEADKSDVECVFDVSDEIINGNSACKNVKVTVEYQDRGCGYFYLTYDSASGVKTHTNYIGLYNIYNWSKFSWEDDNPPAYNEVMYNIKTAEFVLSDARFANGVNGGDFSLTAKNLSQASDFIIYSVTVEILESDGGIDITAESGNDGNIFFKDREGIFEPEFSVSFYNRHTGEKNLTATYTLLNGDKEIIGQTAQKSYTVASNGSAEDVISVGNAEAYGTYYLRVALEGDGVSVSRDISFSVCVKNYGGQVNERMGLNCYFSWGRPAESGMRLMKKAGFANLRDAYAWQGFEREEGVYAEHPTVKSYMDTAKNIGVNTLICAAYGNGIYGMSMDGHHLPETDEQRAAFAEYVYRLLLERSGQVEYIEIWNEPNGATYNVNKLSGGEYMKLVKAVYERVKPEFPDVKICAVSLASFANESAREWLTDALELDDGENVTGQGDAYKYFDVFTIHPYRTDLTTLVSILDEYNTLLEEYNAGDKPIIYTEYGHPQVIKGYNSSTRKGTITLKTQEYQATHILRSTLMEYAHNLAESFYIHTFSNLDISPNYNEHTYGLVEAHNADVPYAAKKAFVAMSSFNNMFREISRGEVIHEDTEAYNESGSKQTNVYKFTSDDGRRTVYSFFCQTYNNTDLYTTEYEFDTNGEEAEFLDMYGNQIFPVETDGIYNLELSYKPIFAVIDREPEIWVTETEGGFLVAGTIPGAETEPLGIKIFDSGEKLSGLTQETTNADGYFEYLFIPPMASEEYALHIGCEALGTKYTAYFADGTAIAVLKLEAGEEEANSMEDIKKNEVFDIRVKFYNEDYAGTGKLIYCTYNQKTLSKAWVIMPEQLKKDGEWYKYSVSAADIGDAENLGIYLWDDNNRLIPLARNLYL